jgi:hydrogenase maturation factor HypF (carbamoyltransferase family)
MYTLGIPNRQYRRCTQVLGPENANPIEYDAVDQGDGFYLFSFPNVDEYEFKDIVMLLKNNGVSVIGADEQLSERKIMKLADLLKEDENPNRMESADDIIDALEKILETWETKEYESDEARWNEYYLDIEDLVTDYKENQSIDMPDTTLQEHKLRKLIQKVIKQ